MQSSYQKNSLNTTYNPSNQDIVLKQFYQQRNKRSNTSSKRHSLLQKNSSYFSNTNYLDITINSQKQTQNNLKYSNYTSNAINVLSTSNTKDHISAVKNQIKDKKIQINQAEIIKKYSNFNKQNYTLPTTPTNNLQEKDKKNKIYNNFNTNNKSHDRQKSLQQLENSFKALTGQQPNYNFKKQQKISHLEQLNDKINKLDKNSIKQKLKCYVESKKQPIMEKTQKKQLNHNSQNLTVNQNIKIVNKVRSNSMKNSKRTQMISIKQYIDNNSFCQKQQDEPLLVLAQKINKKQNNNHSSQSNEKSQQNGSHFSQFIEDKSKLQEFGNQLCQFRQQTQQFQSPNFKMHNSPAYQQRIKKIQMNQKIKSNHSKQNKKIQQSGLKQISKYQKSLKTQQRISNSKASQSYEKYMKQTEEQLLNKYTNPKINKFIHHENQIFKQTTQVKNNQKQKMQQKQMLQLKNKIQELEKINKKQNKFIQSVQSMRKAIQKVDDECNLKELWRWLKVLPSRS